MTDMFGKKRIAELEEKNEDLINRKSKLINAIKNTGKIYLSLKKDYSELQDSYNKQDKDISDLKNELDNITNKNEDLEERLTTIPNRELTTLKAIHELAQNLSNGGYDSFLKDMIKTIVDRGITAYKEIHDLLRGPGKYEGFYDYKDFPPIPDKAIGLMIGQNILDKSDKPKIDLLIGGVPFLETYYEQAAKKHSEKYGSEPSIRLTFRETLLPKEWEEKLETDKDILLKSFGFGFIASYYEDVNQNPSLPTVIKHFYNKELELPKTILEMQERIGLIDNKTLLQDLNECLKDKKFSAGVLGYFKEKSK